jgi:hypothetical protein
VNRRTLQKQEKRLLRRRASRELFATPIPAVSAAATPAMPTMPPTPPPDAPEPAAISSSPTPELSSEQKRLLREIRMLAADINAYFRRVTFIAMRQGLKEGAQEAS